MHKLKVLELFAGLGACSKALERLNIPHEIIDAVEIDKYAIKSFNAIHGTSFEPQDITKWDKDIDVDLIMHGSPCQDFSLAGKQAGGDEGSGTRSSLMYETIRIVEKLKPKYILWENVKNLLSKKHRHNFDAYLETMEKLGYKNYYQVLNAKDYGVPQNRERVFTISIRDDVEMNFTFPQKQLLKLKLKDLLDETVDEKYYLNDAQIDRIKESTYIQNQRRIQEKDYCDTLCARDWKDPKCVEVKRMYGIFDTEKSTHQAGSVYDEDGLSPTLDTMQGGYRQPCVEVKDSIYSDESVKRIKSNIIKNDVANTLIANAIQSFNHNNYTLIEEGYVEKKYKEFVDKNGYIPEMYNPYNNSEIKDVAPTQSTQCGSTTSSATVLIKNDTKSGERTKENIIHTINKQAKHQQDLIQSSNGLCRTIPAGTHGSTPHLLKTVTDYQPLRIRKLTPKECFRLMGFDDEDFEKAQNIPTSNTQLYKQAGNSIVVNVLESIFKELLKDYIPSPDRWSDLD